MYVCQIRLGKAVVNLNSFKYSPSIRVYILQNGSGGLARPAEHYMNGWCQACPKGNETAVECSTEEKKGKLCCRSSNDSEVSKTYMKDG